MTGWLSDEEIKKVGFKTVGRGCKISRNAEFIGAQNISLGDNVRIDTGVLILAASKGAYLMAGSHIHIAARAILSCGGGIFLGNFSTVGFGSKLISASDDFSGRYLVGPEFDPEFIKVTRDLIIVRDHGIITTDCTLLPGAIMQEGTVLGAMSLLKPQTTTQPWHIYVGIPARPIKQRMEIARDVGQKWEEVWQSRQS